MRKVAFSVIATGSLALFVGTGDAEASAYKVQPGDSLWKISAENNVSVSDLRRWNDLTSNLITVDQILHISSKSTNQSVSNKSSNNQAVNPSTTTAAYTVKSGDTLSKIAQQFKISVTEIQQLNQLQSDLIFVGQKVKVNSAIEVPSPSKSQEITSSSVPSTVANDTYKVVSGDTLSAIAYRQGISVTQLKNWNSLETDRIFIGQALKVQNSLVATQSNTPSVVTTAPTSNTGTVKSVVDLAISLQGTPYVWGGSTPSGFDCSGFLHYVYSKAGIGVPRTNVVGFDARSYEVDQPKVGDLVLFKDTYQSGISHGGIYIGNNKFIHAGGDRVQVTDLSNSYWSKHFDSFKRLYAAN